MGSRVIVRRRLIQGSPVLAGLTALAGCSHMPRWSGPKVPRVGYLLGREQKMIAGFEHGLAEHGYVDTIFKGAKPANLPVEKPSIFDLVLNLKTARALGRTIPPSVLQRATEIIQ